MVLTNNVFELEKLSDAFVLPGNIILGFVMPAIMHMVGKIKKRA